VDPQQQDTLNSLNHIVDPNYRAFTQSKTTSFVQQKPPKNHHNKITDKTAKGVAVC
jgi:hypothetical protein